MLNEQEILGELQSFAPLAPSLLQLTELIATDEYTIDDIEETIRFDTALTIDTLKYANSVENAGRAKVATVRDAVVRLGGQRLFKYLYARWLGGVAQRPLKSYGMEPDYFWVHGVTIGLAFELLAANRNIDGAMAFTGGMLHDIGKIVLNNLAERFNLSIEVEANIEDEVLMEMESEVFGVNHRQMSALLMKKWGFPAELTELASNEMMINLAHEVNDAMVTLETGLDISDFSPEVQKIAEEVSSKRMELLQLFGLV